MIRLSITHFETTEMRHKMNGADVTRIERINEFGEKNIEIVDDEYYTIFEWEEDSNGNLVEYDFPF